MKAAKSPIFRDHSKTYHADSCEPLADAVEKGGVEFAAFARGTYPGTPLPNGVLPGLSSVGYWDAIHEQEWGLPWHRNEGIELTWLETGSVSFLLGDEQYTLRPGDLTITRPWQPHKVGNPNVGVGRLHWVILDVGVRQPHKDWRWPRWMILSPQDMTDLTDYLRGNEKPVWTADKKIAECFQSLSSAVTEKDINRCYSRISLGINELFLHLIEMFRDQGATVQASLKAARRSAEMFLDTLDSNLGELWTLQDMAEQSGLGVTSFVHYCKEITNQTPVQYLNDLRLEKAAETLLSDREKSVTDIAFECGFSSSQYFATLFRRRFKCSPRQYRKKTE